MKYQEIRDQILKYLEGKSHKTDKNTMLKEYGLTFQYDDKLIPELLNEIELTGEIENLYTEIMEKYKKRMIIKKWKYFIKDFIKLYIVLGLSAKDVGKLFHIRPHTINDWFKEIGISRTNKEAMQYAKLKRDYTDIHRKGKQTAALKYKASGSDSEEYIRSIINLFLCNYIDLPYIVGCNNISLSSKEIDIPILIINGNNIDKFAIEVSGTNFHKDIEKDAQKQLILESEGFKTITEYIESYNYEEEGKQIAINIMTQIQDYYSNI